MKKLLSMLLSLFVALAVVPQGAMTARAASEWLTVPGIEGGKIEFDSSTGAITDCETSVTVANIPNTINGVKVTCIGAWAFSYCRGLTSMTIPDSVTTMGWWAFSRCSSLTDIHVAAGNPNYASKDGVLFNKWFTTLAAYPGGRTGSYSIPVSVTSIGWGAFDWCESLNGVTIPDSVTSIGAWAFFGCTSLTSVTIPNSVTSIGDVAFAACSSLTGVIIPNSVTSIGARAFSGCTSLTSVTIPNSVTSVAAFEGCSSLTSVTIPNSVTSIGARAFFLCSSLTSVTIPNSVTSIEGSAFSDCSSLKDIYYGGTKAQWEQIRIGSLNEELENATIHYNSTAEDMYADQRKKNVPKGKYVFRVMDNAGKSISGVAVSVNGTEYTTDNRGEAAVPSFSAADPVITISKTGYQTWTNADSNWKKSKDRYETVVLYTEAEGKYKLQKAVYSNSAAFSDHLTNLLVSTKKLALKNDGNLIGDLDFGNFYLSVKSYIPEQTAKYQLLQGNTVKAESTDGKFALNVKSFSKGGNCSVRVVAKDGTKVDTHINLEFAENKINSTTRLDLKPGSISFKVPDDVPYVGGSNFDVDLPLDFPLIISADDEMIQIGLNVKSGDKKTEKQRIQEVKKLFQDTKKASGLQIGTLSKQQEKIYNSLIKDKNGMKFFKNGEISGLGYLELNHGSQIAKGYILIRGKIDAMEYEYNTWVYVVPVTAQVGIELGLGAAFEAGYDFANTNWFGSVDIEPSAKLTAFGGIGVSKAIGVGAYGSAELEGKVRVIGNPFGLQSIDLTGELGLKAYIAFLTYERAFAHHTWNLYTANNVKKAPVKVSEAAAGDLYDITGYVPEDFSYLEQESGWLGGNARQQLSLREGAAAKVDLNPLLTSTYRNAQPSMTSAGNRLYGTFLRMGSNQQVYTAVTVFDGSTWSAPVRADSAAQLDDAPQLYTGPDGTVYLTYAQTKPGTDSTDMLEYAKNQRIVIGTVAENGSFTKMNAFAPTAGSRAYLQTLGTVNGKPALAWAEAAITGENDIFTPAQTLVKLSAFDGTAWSAAETVAALNHPLYSLTLGEEGAAVLMDTDGDLHTLEDTRLSLFAPDGTETALAAGVTGKVTYAKLPGETAPAYVWNAEETLVTDTGKAVPAPGITSEYQITEDGVYYSRAEGSSADLVKLPYSQGAWGEPIRLTNGGRYLENLQVTALGETDYVFGMHTAVTIDETSVIPDKNLVWARVVPVSDLRIESIEYDRDIVTPGESVPVKVSVANAGDHAVSRVLLTRDSETPVDGGSLAIGESKEITVHIPCPETLTEYSFTVTEGDQTTAADYTPDDNRAKASIGYGNLAVSLSYEQIGEARDLVAVVENTGVDKMSGKVTFYDDAGTAYAETKLGEMAAGDITVVRFPVPASFSSRFGGDATARVTSDTEELYDYDNIAALNISEVLNAEITDLTASGAGIAAQIHYEGKDGLASAYCAFYDGNGRMLRLQSAPLTALTAEYRFGTVPHGVTAKVFVLQNDALPLCESRTVDLTA